MSLLVFAFEVKDVHREANFGKIRIQLDMLGK